jgi:N-acyl-L-homoserine lactone synthetase
VTGVDPDAMETGGTRVPGPDRSAAGADRLARGDTLAAAILDELAPLRFGEATGPVEREECYGLRYRAILENRMAPAERFTSGLEHDAFDDYAVQIIGRDEGQVIATCRLVLTTPGRALPAEAEFGLRLPDAAVELGRVVVDPKYRGDGHSVFMGLAAQAWLSMRARGFTIVIGATTQRLIALFEALGFHVLRLGEPRTYWGEERQPFLCDGRRAVAGVEQRRTAGAETPAAGDEDGPQ